MVTTSMRPTDSTMPPIWSCVPIRARIFLPRIIKRRRRDGKRCGRKSRCCRRSNLPHHARGKPGLAPRRLDVFLQEAMAVLAGIAGAGIGPGPAFIVGGAGGLAGGVAIVALWVENFLVAAKTVDRGFDGAVARLDHAGTAHAGDAAIILHPRRHIALEPAHRAAGDVGRVAEGP